MTLLMPTSDVGFADRAEHGWHNLREHTIAVGPEGGFSDEEVALAIASGWQAVTLGPRILRVETAAIVLAMTVLRLP